MMTSRSGRWHLRLVLNTLIVFLGYQEIAACQEPNAQRSVAAEEVTTPRSQNPLADLVIGEGDLLQISLYGVPDFIQHVRVDANGNVSLPMIGVVKVIGFSTEQTERVIEKELKNKGFYDNPQVTVLQQEFGGQGISVLGEVQKPGMYPVLGTSKLFDMISAAGGTTAKAGRDALITHRTQPNNVQKVTLSSEPDKQKDNNVEVFPGDTIVVTKGAIVYVVGDVKLPGGFIINNSKGLTVLEALALAQGANSTAMLNSSKIIHKTDQGPIETRIYLKRILEGKAEDVKLEADDILFVPHSVGKSPGGGTDLPLILPPPHGGMIFQDLPLILPPPQGGSIFQ